MVDEADGVDEAFEASLRVGLTLAGRMAEQAARAREQQARDAQAASEQQARELAGRLDSERLAARAQLAATEHDQWWTAAEPDRIAEAWQTASTWRDLDPDAAAAAERIRTQVRDRYGVDVDDPRADAGALAEAIAHADRDARGEQVEASLLLAEADRADRAQQPDQAAHAERDAAAAYDSAERRRALATSLERLGDAELVEARVLADTAQARPADQAVATSGAPAAGRAPRPAKQVKRRDASISRD